MALPVGHGLVGIAIGKKTKINPLTAFVLANIADFDYFFGLFWAGGNMLTFHRSPLTHSIFFGIPVALLFWLWGNFRKKPYSQKQLLGIYLIVTSHWFIDTFMPFLYRFDFNIGKNGLLDFLFAHIISFEFVYNNLVDVLLYGTIYILVVKFVFKEKKFF